MPRFKIKNISTYAQTASQVFRVAKNPISILSHYVARTSPEFIHLRNGITIKTSSNPHDVITFIVVFCRKDYGKIKKDSFVADVGANIGMFSLYALSEGARHVESFEPNSEAFATLTRNITDNGFADRTKLHNVAVSGDGNSTVLIPISSSPYNQTMAADGQSDMDGMEEVPTVNLEEVLGDVDHIDLVKMDCEGAEFDIFPSLSDAFLDRIGEVRMELHDSVGRLAECFTYQPFRIVRKQSNDVWLVK